MKASKEIAKKLKDLKDAYLVAARDEFKVGFVALFDKYPDLKSVAWRQYTPFFLDGDENVFRVNADEPTINGFDEYGEGDDGEGVNINARAQKETYSGGKYVPNPDYDKEAAACVTELIDFLGSFDDDLFKDLFDDHVEVVATRKGFKTSEYDHD